MTQVPVLTKFHKTYFSLPLSWGRMQYTVLQRSGLNPYGTDPSFALRNQNRLLQQMSYPELRHHLISISLNELDPSNDPLAESQRICKHHLRLRSHRITTEETTLAPTCTEPRSLLTIHRVPISLPHYFLASKMTPVQSYRTTVHPGTSSRRRLRETASSQADCSDEPK
jgi:hypothetical protein